MTVQPKLLSYGNEETADMSNPKYFSNSIGWANEDSKDIGEILNCECNQVYNIYKKAKEMG